MDQEREMYVKIISKFNKKIRYHHKNKTKSVFELIYIVHSTQCDP